MISRVLLSGKTAPNGGETDLRGDGVVRFHQVYMKLRDAAPPDEQVRAYLDTAERLDEARRSRSQSIKL